MDDGNFEGSSYTQVAIVGEVPNIGLWHLIMAPHNNKKYQFVALAKTNSVYLEIAEVLVFAA